MHTLLRDSCSYVLRWNALTLCEEMDDFVALQNFRGVLLDRKHGDRHTLLRDSCPYALLWHDLHNFQRCPPRG